MPRAWPKQSAWPYEAKTGARSWRVGYYDHEGRERTRTHDTKSQATAWIRDYNTVRERPHALRDFLLGPPAAAANEQMTTAELVADWLDLDADPETPGGLAPATFKTYSAVASKHIIGLPYTDRGKLHAPVPYAIGAVGAAALSDPDTIRAWRDGMRDAKASPSVIAAAWKVLSACLGWATEHPDYPVTRNACLLVARNRAGRRSSRRGGTGAQAPKRESAGMHWALGPEAVERIRYWMVHRGADELLAWRNATAVALQHGLGLRNQEDHGVRWGDIDGDRIHLPKVISSGMLDIGKTAGSGRVTGLPADIDEILSDFKARCRAAGRPCRARDFVIYGRHPAGHLTDSEAHKFGQRYFTPAVAAVAAAHPHLAGARGATPYALRRGGISLRLRHEDAAAVARDCGTSTKMLSDHYAFVLAELRGRPRRPAEVERRAARARVWAE